MSAVILDDWEDEIELGLVGIASHLEDYRLAFTLNKSLGSCLKNAHDLLSVTKKSTAFNYSIFKSSASKTTPLFYMVDNQSIQQNGTEQSATLFNDDAFSQTPLISSLKKWHYLLLCEDTAWLKTITHLRSSKHVLLLQNIDLKKLSKNEQSLLTSLTYDE